MNAMILLAQGAMNMADSLATANPVLTEVNAPEMNMLDMAIKGGWIMIVLPALFMVKLKACLHELQACQKCVSLFFLFFFRKYAFLFTLFFLC